jgi:hypothetical protein
MWDGCHAMTIIIKKMTLDGCQMPNTTQQPNKNTQAQQGMDRK